MKLHPALLGLGLIVAAGLACNFSVGRRLAQSGEKILRKLHL